MSVALLESLPKSRLKALLDHFGQIEDPREPWRVAQDIGVKIALDPARVGTILGRCKTQHLSRRINLKSCCGDFPPLSILTASPDEPRRSSAGVRSTVALTCCAWRWPAALVACR